MSSNNYCRKGIILAGGSGTRLHPVTRAISKQLLPVYDKPMVYYPLSTLMLAGIRDILLISTLRTSQLPAPAGAGSTSALDPLRRPATARRTGPAFLIGRELSAQTASRWCWATTFSMGRGFSRCSSRPPAGLLGATVFAYLSRSATLWGGRGGRAGTGAVAGGEARQPKSNYAVTGLYFYDNQVLDIAATLRPSARGTRDHDVNRIYLERGQLRVEILTRGFAWLDTGTHESLLQASNFVQTIRTAARLKIAASRRSRSTRASSPWNNWTNSPANRRTRTESISWTS